MILWDVDHTLIENGGVSKETYALAFQMLVGVPPRVRPQTDGRTDQLIMSELFLANGVPLTAGHRSNLFSALIEAMKRNTGALRDRGHALPGARDALVAVSRQPGYVQSVLTGNIVQNAVAKLSAFDLHHLIDFEVGGFGSDAIERPALVAIAQRKATAKYVGPFDRQSTILLGDTVLDVRAGRDGGARVVAVATGTNSPAELAEAGADRVLPDLKDTEALLTALAEVRSE